MQIKHESVKIGQDENGVFFKIQFTPDYSDKIYAHELFEEAIESKESLDISISSHIKARKRPPAFFNKLDSKERERIKKALDLRPLYTDVRPDLNSYQYLANILKNNPPKLGFNAKSIEEHKIWSKKLVEKVKELSGYNLGTVPLKIEEGPEVEFEDLILKKYYITTAPFLKLPAILARPKIMKKPMPGIIALHGHNKGKINTIGMESSASNSYYGIDLAKRGYVTLSLDQWGWGERRGYYKKPELRFEEVFSLSAQLLGKYAIGIRSWDVSRSIDFLKTFDFVNNKFAVIGQSGGGTTAAFSSVLDDRIDAAVISGYFCNWTESIFAMRHCACNFIPGMLQYADLPDIMATRAPKPTFIISGEKDPIFPQNGVQEGYASLKKAYELYNKTENLQIDVIKDTGHVFRGDRAYPWLDKVLLEN